MAVVVITIVVVGADVVVLVLGGCVVEVVWMGDVVVGAIVVVLVGAIDDVETRSDEYNKAILCRTYHQMSTFEQERIIRQTISYSYG